MFPREVCPDTKPNIHFLRPSSLFDQILFVLHRAGSSRRNVDGIENLGTELVDHERRDKDPGATAVQTKRG